MKSFWICCFALSLTAGLASFGLSEDKKKDKAEPDFAAQFKKLDDNGNGFLVQAEYVGNKTGEAKEEALKTFRRKDKDKDLQLTLAEFKAPVKKPQDKKKKDNGEKKAAGKK